MYMVLAGFADEDDSEEQQYKDNPIVKIDLAAHVAEELRKMYAANKSGFEACCSHLTPEQLAAVKTAFNK
jgi:hypothetical protein